MDQIKCTATQARKDIKISISDEEMDFIHRVLGDRYNTDEPIPLLTLVKVISLHDPNWLKAEKEKQQ